MLDTDNFTPQATQDGSFTFFSQEFNEAFHSHHGAKQESYLKFAFPTQVQTVAKNGIVRILDVCYGLGYNTAAALEVIWQENPTCIVEIMGLELNPEVPKAAINQNIFNDWDDEYRNILTELAFKHHLQTNRLQAKLLIGDARKSIQEVRESGFLADAIFLDPFSPPQCPQLWTIEFIQNVALCLHENGLLATYSCAAAVRTALLSAGLVIGSTTPVGRRTPGTIAAYSKNREKDIIDIYPLSQAETEHLQTRAAIPYRDPELSDSAEVIIRRRQQEQQTSPLEPTSKWHKRWLGQV
ncbi:tRNA (5-methylaminomethyl-2-thiouridine)(34)-methyltransferase MnmD [Anabaena sp. UHCC 0451]|uniref:tRNA (5-methylaminomethyl-2-thiouridine)(34)-methyltransferase MnmD n=1 Tax=Anabaena sp. UHCC 0451 TaxID=2055235 RepID=UPI002B21D717|nr:MnmC family methyltransferase [Anabaena sp. UHCC 0451]MEA5579268.1 MnmC family methyltransferase [Anabaena sp. UHCC 0451]